MYGGLRHSNYVINSSQLHRACDVKSAILRNEINIELRSSLTMANETVTNHIGTQRLTAGTVLQYYCKDWKIQ